MPSTPRYVAGDNPSAGVILCTPAPWDTRVLRDTKGAVHQSALGELFIARADHDAEGQRPHNFTDLHRRDIGTARVHPAAHGGVDRNVGHRDDDLPIGRLA